MRGELPPPALDAVWEPASLVELAPAVTTTVLSPDIRQRTTGAWAGDGVTPRSGLSSYQPAERRSHEAQVLALHGMTWSWAGPNSGHEAGREIAAEEKRGKGETNQPLGGTS